MAFLRSPGDSAAGARSGRLRSTIILGLVSGLLVSTLWLAPGWRTLELQLYDLGATLAPPRPPEPGAVIVAIDEPAFAEIGLLWPWPRDLHARLIESLRRSGAAVIALDIIFAEPSTPDADAALAAVLAPDVILAGDETVLESPHGIHTIRVLPLPEFLAAGSPAGIASVALDGDGVVRRVPGRADGFARRIAQIRDGATPVPAPADALIRYLGPARSYPTVSYYQALEPERYLPPGLFEDRAVIVGLSLQNAPSSDSAAADAFATSYTAITGQLTAGAEIHANILDNLVHGLWVRPVHPGWSVLAGVFFALAACAAMARAGPVPGMAAALVLVGAAGAMSYGLLQAAGLWLAPVVPALAVIGAAGLQGGVDFARERALRRSIARAFAQYLSPELVDQLARHPERLRLGGERRPLTVLFCDVRGFTGLAETYRDDPEALTGLVNRLLTPLSDAVLEAGGTIDKYMGDCIMAFWNAPLDDPDHAVRAVTAARAMFTALDRLNDELAGDAGFAGRTSPRFAVGVGVNTGECIVGNMGTARRFDYSAMGDAVNLAARFEGASKQYGVGLILGPETAAQASTRFALVELDRLAVKGKAEAVSIFTVIGERDETGSQSCDEALRQHRSLLDAYRAKDWEKAGAALRYCRVLTPALRGYHDVMAARIRRYRETPPPEDWRGVYVALDK